MKKEDYLFSVIPVSQLLMLMGSLTEKKALGFWGWGGLLLSVAADFLLLSILLWSSRHEKLEQEFRELSYLQKTERMRNGMLEEKQKEILALRSSFEKRLKAIQGKLEEGESEAAVREMELFQADLEEVSPPAYCQNAVVNAVLAEKDKELQKLHVQAVMELLVPRGLKINPLYLCSIFSNLLDNALEALAELPEAERRLELDAGIKGVYLFVRIRNTASLSHAMRKRRKGRGYGTQILRETAEACGGSYQAGYEKGWYTAAVMVKVE